QLSQREVYQLFLSVMTAHGYSVLTQDGQSRVVPIAEAKTEANAPRNSADHLETRLIEVQHQSASELLPLIRPLVPQYGHLAAIPSSNALIISDRRANIARLEQLIQQLDQQSGHRSEEHTSELQ